MKRSETVQKLVLFSAMAAGAVLVAEGYLQARAFVARVDSADRQISLLKQEVNALRVQVDVTPQPTVQPGPILAAVPQAAAFPIPEPMRLPLPAPERRQKPARVKDTAQTSADEQPKTDGVPDDGRIVLMKEPKAAPAPPTAPAATATVDVKLLVKK